MRLRGGMVLEGSGVAMDASQDRVLVEAGWVEALVDLVGRLSGEFDLHESFQMLVDECVKVLNVADAGMLLAGDGHGLRVIASSSERVALLQLLQLQAGEGPCLECHQTGKAVATGDLDACLSRWPRFVPAAVEQGFQSVIAVPMRVHGRLIGAVNVFGTIERSAGGSTNRVLQAMTDLAAITIGQAQLSRQHLTLIVQLETALESRVSIEQAKGLVAGRLNVSPDQAFALLRHRARSSHRLLVEVAREAISSGGSGYPHRPRNR